MEQTKVLIAGAEAIPFAKTGGLADVIGTLPAYLKEMGADVRVMIPFHSVIKAQYDHLAQTIAEFSIWVGWRQQYVGIRKLEHDGITFYFVDNNDYFSGPIYRGGEPEGEQYAYFSRAVLEALEKIDFMPQVIHCNDWHTAMIPMLIKTQYQDRPQGRIRTLLTIHNMMYQGKYSFGFVKDVLAVEDRYLTPRYIAHDDAANYLKAGIVFADKINTVSPSYAEELKDPYYAYGLEGILNYRSADLSGIVNGINNAEYDPENDPYVEFPFHPRAISGKKKNKKKLYDQLGLNGSANTPMIAMVTRLTEQKGVDLVLRVIHEIMAENVTFVLLGSGDAQYEYAFRMLEQQYKGRFCAYIGYDNPLAHLIYASADLFLMPSRFEPCGISQMIAMRYGSLPIVRETGGLRDTVQPYNEFTGEGNGFTFSNFNAHDMLHVIRYALQTISDSKVKRKIMAHAMGAGNSFSHSAAAYLDLYRSLTQMTD